MFPAELAEVQQSLARTYRKRSNIGIASALILQIVGVLLAYEGSAFLTIIGLALVLCGGCAWYYGLGTYARSKGRSAWFALLGILGLIGLIVLVLLPNRYAPKTSAVSPARKVIIGLLVFMVLFYGFCAFMVSMQESSGPDRPDVTTPLTHIRVLATERIG